MPGQTHVPCTRMGSHRVQIRQKAAALDAEEAKRRFQVAYKPCVHAIITHRLQRVQQLDHVGCRRQHLVGKPQKQKAQTCNALYNS